MFSDDCVMLITDGEEKAMNLIQALWNKTKKTLKFIWRHICTLYILSVIVRAIMAGHISVINSFIFLSGAIFIDWAKQLIKYSISVDK